MPADIDSRSSKAMAAGSSYRASLDTARPCGCRSRSTGMPLPFRRCEGRSVAIAAAAICTAVTLFILGGIAESWFISLVRPSEGALTWVSDVVLASSLGVVVYLWLHLRVSRAAGPRARAKRNRARYPVDRRRQHSTRAAAAGSGSTAWGQLGRPALNRRADRWRLLRFHRRG